MQIFSGANVDTLTWHDMGDDYKGPEVGWYEIASIAKIDEERIVANYEEESYSGRVVKVLGPGINSEYEAFGEQLIEGLLMGSWIDACFVNIDTNITISLQDGQFHMQNWTSFEKIELTTFNDFWPQFCLPYTDESDQRRKILILPRYLRTHFHISLKMPSETSRRSVKKIQATNEFFDSST